MKKTTLYIPEDLAISVSNAAKQSGRSEASVIREAIATYVTTLERPRPRTIGAIADDSLQSEDIEDWIYANWRPE